MANEDNLRPLSTSEAREVGSKGGKASAASKRRKKEFRDVFQALLDGRDIKGPEGKKITGTEALAMKVFQQALKGDLRAFEIIRDTVGQKPVDKVEVSAIDQSVKDDVDRLISEALEDGTDT
jgi:hypothetical protein